MLLGIGLQCSLLIASRNDRNAQILHRGIVLIGSAGIIGAPVEKGGLQSQGILSKIVFQQPFRGLGIGTENINLSLDKTLFKMGGGIQYIDIVPARMIGDFPQVVGTVARHFILAGLFQEAGIIHIADVQRGRGCCQGRLSYRKKIYCEAEKQEESKKI